MLLDLIHNKDLETLCLKNVVIHIFRYKCINPAIEFVHTSYFKKVEKMRDLMQSFQDRNLFLLIDSRDMKVSTAVCVCVYMRSLCRRAGVQW